MSSIPEVKKRSFQEDVKTPLKRWNSLEGNRFRLTVRGQ